MNAQMKITVFNRRLGSDRRGMFFPCCIASASYYEDRSSSHDTDGNRSEKLSYKLRIPYNAITQNSRTYVSAAAYKLLAAEEAMQHWTIQKGDIVLTQETALDEPIDETALQALARSSCCDAITITEYADNTIRGTDAVKHWRIGGE